MFVNEIAKENILT